MWKERQVEPHNTSATQLSKESRDIIKKTFDTVRPSTYPHMPIVAGWSCNGTTASWLLINASRFSYNSPFTITNTHTYKQFTGYACMWTRFGFLCALHMSAATSCWRAIYDQTQAIVLSTSTKHAAVEAEAAGPQQRIEIKQATASAILAQPLVLALDSLAIGSSFVCSWSVIIRFFFKKNPHFYLILFLTVFTTFVFAHSVRSGLRCTSALS